MTKKNSKSTQKKRPSPAPIYRGMASDTFQSQTDVDELNEMIQQRKQKIGADAIKRPLGSAGGEQMAGENWIVPIGESVCVDTKNGRWSDGAFFADLLDEQDSSVEWHQAEPAPHVQDHEVWRRWLEFLETSPSAAEILLIVAKSRARAKVEGLV